MIKLKSDNTSYMSQNNNFFCTDYFVYQNFFQWLSIFLLKLVSILTKFITFSIELYCVPYFLNYIYYELVTLEHSIIHELGEKCYREFGYK